MNANKKLKVFVVEDNLIFQQLIGKQLESLSYSIKFFTNGEDCIEALKSSTPDIIVLDNSLSGLMSGLDTLKIVRVIHPDLYIVLFSTEKTIDTMENHLHYGSFIFLEKNVGSFQQLKQKIYTSEVFLRKASQLNGNV